MQTLRTPHELEGSERNELRTLIDSLEPGKGVHVGLIDITQKWKNNNAHQSAERLLPHLAHTGLGMPNVTSTKLGRGCGSIPATTGHIAALLLWWIGPRGAMHFEEVYKQHENAMISRA